MRAISPRTVCTRLSRQWNRAARVPAPAHVPSVKVTHKRGVRVFANGDFDDFVQVMQDRICKEAALADGCGKEFIVDRWDRGEGGKNGFGITRVLQGGDLLEKAAANVSVVRGNLTPARAQAMSSRGRDVDPNGGQAYSAAALSLVFHSAGPMVPTFRADVRYFQVEGGDGWYGGGADLTPYYLEDEDARDFHNFWKLQCDAFGGHLYPAYKKWCDDYFYIPMRKEHRGVGGIFFDDLMATKAAEAVTGEEPLVACDDPAGFTQSVAENLMASYLPIAERRRSASYTDEQRHWQLLRRGRYLEFNLLYDRGVKFGLDGGRVESIMVSAPPMIAWDYNVVPESGSREEYLINVLQAPREWATK
eukprot:CAMPEP_0118924580 /NCGR_PEP_ID=MMETSP1169-20130426/2652_1 /TAXON_ID=36882 /ORGANISM="Pyramimonas obovata, Strain CCMP722" /LENGTH=361 /DNA_ID=CAMNT_0006865707 /DNA_START=100 /DNA_END=1185 /DNA_ORIENTATION=+